MPLTRCNDADCDRPRLDGAIFCARHIGAKRQCKATKPGSNGTIRCKKPALRGLEVCERHGGGTKKSLKVRDRAEQYVEMQRFTRPYEGDLNPYTAFTDEMRRTLGRIAWLEEKIASLVPDDLIWGRTKVESIGAGEFTGTNTTHEARVHGWEELLWRERRHLLDLEKVWISADLDQQSLNLMKTYVTQTYELTKRALEALGHDTTKPEVRAVMAEVFDVRPTSSPVAALESRHADDA